MKVLICGAGIAGLALAQRMQSHGWEVCIVEQAPGPRRQGYMLDFIGPGYAAAEAMGVLPRLKRVAYRLERGFARRSRRYSLHGSPLDLRAGGTVFPLPRVSRRGVRLR
jgi:2-polyprenyl-6-methoxyphenol hydroxylase-like FAD-dependent oxidoreductase